MTRAPSTPPDSVRRAPRIAVLLGAALAVALTGCGREREMAESVQVTDSMDVMPAMKDARARDAMLDTMPGGEMARGDSAAEMRLLKEKM